MNKKRVKRYLCCMCAVMMTISATGCAETELGKMTAEEENMYVQYAANLILKHDKNNIDRMIYVEAETKPQETESQTTTPGQEEETTQTTGQETATDINGIVSASGFDIQPNGYQVLEAYPSDGGNLGMSMIAVKGYKLLVVNLKVTNTSGADQTLNMLETKAQYKGIINDSIRLNAQVTALLDAFNTYHGTIPAGGSEDLVLVFQVNENDVASINSVKLNITYNDKQGTVAIN